MAFTELESGISKRGHGPQHGVLFIDVLPRSTLMSNLNGRPGTDQLLS
jgi:hypothetical protein